MTLKNMVLFLLIAAGLENLEGTPTAIPQTVTGCVGALITGQLGQTGGTGVTGPTGIYFAEVFQSNSNGVAVIQPGGMFTFAPSSPNNPTGAFQFTVSDATLTASAPATVTIDIIIPHAASASFASPLGLPIVSTLVPLVSAGQFPFTFQLACPPSHGIAIVNPDGTFTYTPNLGFTGTDSFRYQAVDANGCPTSTAIIYINVGTACTLVANPGVATICNNSSLTGTLSALGISGGASFFLVTGSSQNGFASVLPNGQFNFTAATGATGPAGFTFGVTDSASCSSTASEAITLNQAPVANNTTLTSPQGFPVNSTLNGLVSGGTPPYTFAQVGSAVNGTVTVNSDGSFIFTPNVSMGIGSFEYQATDSSGTHCVSNVATVFIDIGGCSLIANSGTGAVCQNNSLTGTLTATGASGPTNFFFITGTNTNGTVTVLPNGQFFFTGAATGPGGFEFGVSDSLCTATGTEIITVNANPVASNQTLTTSENTPINGSLVTLVTGGTPPYTFGQVGSAVNGTVVINSNGTFTFTPTTGFVGTASFQYHATDSSSTHCVSNVATVTINVIAPVCTLVANSGTGGVCQGNAVTGTLSATGASGPTSFFFVTGTNTNGIVTISPNGQFIFTGAAAGPGGFEFGVSDAICTVTGTESIAINAKPVASNQTLTTPENTPLNGSLAAIVTGGTQPYTFMQVGSAINGMVSINSSNGVFTFTPTAGFVGIASFQYQVTDSSSTHCASNVATITINVTPPTCTLVALPGTGAVCQNAGLAGTLAATGASGPTSFFFVTGSNTHGTVTVSPNGQFFFTGSASGPGGFEFGVSDTMCTVTGTETIFVHANTIATGQTISTIENTPVNGSLAPLVSGGTPPYTFAESGTAVNGTVVINSITGAFTFTPDPNFIGTASFSYVATDSNGCPSDPALIFVNVTRAPCTLVAIAGTGAICEDSSLTGTLTVSGASGVADFFLITGSVQGGTVTVAPNGQFIFTGTAGVAGPGGFQFGVTDVTDCISTALETISINALPVAANHTFTTPENTPITNGSLVSLVTDGTSPYTFVQIGSALNGVAVVNSNGTFSFIPTPNSIGTGSFQYQVTDSSSTHCVSNIATVTINIVCNLVANPQTVATCTNTSVTGQLTSIPDAPGYIFSLISEQHGTAIVNADGSYMFTPESGFTGIASFQFSVMDLAGCTAQATVTITVGNPIARNAAFGTNKNTTVQGTLVPDVSGGTPPYTFTQIGMAVNGVAVVNSNGTFSFTPTTDFVGTGSFTYQATDSSGCMSNIATVTITITQCPVVTDPFYLLYLEIVYGVTQ